MNRSFEDILKSLGMEKQDDEYGQKMYGMSFVLFSNKAFEAV